MTPADELARAAATLRRLAVRVYALAHAVDPSEIGEADEPYIVDIEGALRPVPDRPGDAASIQDDLRAIMEAIGVSTHARPYSPHEVVHRDILPALAVARAVNGEVNTWRESLAGEPLPEVPAPTPPAGADTNTEHRHDLPPHFIRNPGPSCPACAPDRILAKVKAERDAALRERDEARAGLARVEKLCDEVEKHADTYKDACIVTTGKVRAALRGEQ